MDLAVRPWYRNVVWVIAVELFVLGTGMNRLAQWANGGRMPVHEATAWRMVEEGVVSFPLFLSIQNGVSARHFFSSSPALPQLCDWIPYLTTVASIGDVLLDLSPLLLVAYFILNQQRFVAALVGVIPLTNWVFEFGLYFGIWR